MATLALRSVRKEYGKLVALDGLDLDVGDGGFLVLAQILSHVRRSLCLGHVVERAQSNSPPRVIRASPAHLWRIHPDL